MSRWHALDLGCNGLHAPDLPFSPFPTHEPIVLTWSPAAAEDAVGAAPWGLEALLTAEATGWHWWSGVLASSEPLLELPPAVRSALAPATTYHWRVRLYGANSSAAAGNWSATSLFDTAPDAAQWSRAAWIGGASQLDATWALPATPVVWARAFASGLGCFELAVNGATLGDHVMDPGESVYDERVLHVGFNVTAARPSR